MITVTGHRGCAGLEPENTIRAFKRAVELGVNFIEFDVRETKDKKLVVIHDPKVDRTTNGKGYVRDLTLQEIKKLHGGGEEKIPTFEETIQFLKDKPPRITIEVKEPSTLERILDVVKKNKLERKVVLISFWHNIIKAAKEKYPNIETSAVIVGNPIDPVSMVKDCKADKISMNNVFVDREFVEKCHKNGIKIIAWEVNEPAQIKRMIDLGVDTISSNYPDRVIEMLR